MNRYFDSAFILLGWGKCPETQGLGLGMGVGLCVCWGGGGRELHEYRNDGEVGTTEPKPTEYCTLPG